MRMHGPVANRADDDGVTVGGARATISMPTMPFTPRRLSTTTGCPSASRSGSAIIRPVCRACRRRKRDDEPYGPRRVARVRCGRERDAARQSDGDGERSPPAFHRTWQRVGLAIRHATKRKGGYGGTRCLEPLPYP